MLRLTLISVIAVILSSPVLGQAPAAGFDGTYRWPLKLDKRFSSDFGDRRPGRFHMGVDIRTGGREGAPVYAPEDGYVSRIKTSYTGYGKALYIRGKSGRQYVFGHLKTYNWDIGTYLQKKQVADERYYQDMYPAKDELMIKKGQLVARSGQTGTGAPHLHFEVRDVNDRPTHPLLYDIDFTDKTPPAFEAVWLTYLDSVSLFDNGRREVKLVARPGRDKSRYIIVDTLMVTGRFAVKAAVSDFRGRGSFTLAPSRVSLRIDGRLYHEIEYRRLDYAENHYSMLDKDPDPVKKEQYKRVYNLYRRPGNLLSNYRYEVDGDGSFTAAENGYHTVIIEAEDPFGNISDLEFVFYYSTASDILDVFNRAIISDSVITMPLVVDTLRAPFDSVVLAHVNGADDTLPIPLMPEITYENFQITLRGGFQAWPHYIMSFYTEGRAYPTCAVSVKQLIPAGQTVLDSSRTRIVDGGLLVTVWTADDAVNWLQAEILADFGRDRRFYTKTGPNRFSLYYHVPETLDSIASIISRGPVGFRPDTLEVALFRMAADADAAVSLLPGISLVAEVGDLFDDILVTIRDTVTAQPRTGYVVSGPFVLDPGMYPFADWATLESDVTSSPDAARCGLYVWRDAKGWLWAGGELDNAAGMLRSDIGGGGVVAVIADTTAPSLSKFSIGDDERIKISRPEIRFTVDDELSGIENDRNFRITIDDKWVSPEYDIESKTMKIKPHWRLSPGRHTLKIDVTDRCGNTTTATRTFRVRSAAG